MIVEKDAKQSGSKVLVALEVCLEAASSSLEDEAFRFELEAQIALEKLTSKMSTRNFERVRQIKSRLVARTGRLQKVRDELEHLLDDDEDMSEMYLTKKLDKIKIRSLLKAYFSNLEHLLDDDEDVAEMYLTEKLDKIKMRSLLKAYLVQIDGTLNKLREYVDDTEDYMNRMVDEKQKHLVEMNVMLTRATLVINVFLAVALVMSVLDMNINIKLVMDEEAGPRRFLWAVIGASLGSLFLYVGAAAWCKYKRLLE